LPARVLITSTSFGKAAKEPLEFLKSKGYRIIWSKQDRPLGEEEAKEKVSGVDAWIAGVDRIGQRVLSCADRLKVIARFGVGTDTIDIEEATRRGIVVTNTPGANYDAVADFTFGLILSIARFISQADRNVKEGGWGRFFGYPVWGRTLGIIGMGKIGMAVAKRASGFNMRVIYSDIRVNPEAEKIGIKKVDLDFLLREADFVSLHVPLTPQTRNLIGKDELTKMKSTSFLINTARGGVVDEDALYSFLKDKRILGAALDVYREEPPRESPLLSLDNVITTPHIASYTYEALNNMGMIAAQCVIDVIEGRRPRYVVNEKVYNK